MIDHKDNSGLKEKLKELLPVIIDIPPKVEPAVLAEGLYQVSTSTSLHGHYEEGPSSYRDTETCATNNSLMNQLKAIGRTEIAQVVTPPPSTSGNISSKNIGDKCTFINRRGKHLKYDTIMVQNR